MQKCPAAWQMAFRFITAILPRLISTLDGVIHYNSIFRRGKQENEGFALLMQKKNTHCSRLKTWAYINYVSYCLDRISDTSRVNVSSRHLFLSSHSQTTITFQPDSRRSSLLRLSRATFPRILGSQYSWLEDGQTKRGQSCLCKASVYKNYSMVLRKDNIGAAGQASNIFAVSETPVRTETSARFPQVYCLCCE